jgi:hypothetical protein
MISLKILSSIWFIQKISDRGQRSTISGDVWWPAKDFSELQWWLAEDFSKV